MEEAKTLIRTTVRTFFPHPKQILVVDALMLHSVLHIEDLAVLLSSQPKDIRSFINPLRSSRLLSTHSRLEARVGSTGRGVQRDYYYCPLHPAIDAIKYRIAKLRRKVAALYQQDETKRKDWRCPRCKAEYEELQILDKLGPEGFYCDRCGETLIQNEQAAKDKGNHEKILKLNNQLKKFDELIAAVDRQNVPENDFLDAWSRKRDVPRDKGGRSESQYIELKREIKGAPRGPDIVKAENLSINLASSAEQAKADAEREEERKQRVAKQNLLPVWHTNSAIGPGGPSPASVKQEDFQPSSSSSSSAQNSSSFIGAGGLKKEEDEDKKPELNTIQDEVALYLADMERERLEAERKAKEEDAESEGEDGDFEDVIGTSVVGTPASSQQDGGGIGRGGAFDRALNGIKRERDFDEESSEANTPASFADGGSRDSKRVKFENGATSAVKMESNGSDGGVNGNNVKLEGDADSEEEEDFEDAM